MNVKVVGKIQSQAEQQCVNGVKVDVWCFIFSVARAVLF